MSETESSKAVTLKDQMKKFVIKGLLGFHSVVVFAMGRKLGIFDYLAHKAKASAGAEKITAVSFSLDELVTALHLDMKYLDAWIHMGIACGLFEVDQTHPKTVRTEPFVYDLLVDRDGDFYMGNTLALFNMIGPYEPELLKKFQTGEIFTWEDLDPDAVREGHMTSATLGRNVADLFSRKCRDFSRKLRQGGSILEVGCGYGFNLANWAKRYKSARVVGIDPDPKAVASAKDLAVKEQWSDRAQFLNTTTSEYVKTNPGEFDIIVLNMVLHEMNPDENYRRSVVGDLYGLVKDDGVVVLADTVIPDTFALNQERQIFDIMHKWLEVGFGSKFYDEAGIKALLTSTPFKNVEFVKEGNVAFWALKK